MSEDSSSTEPPVQPAAEPWTKPWPRPAPGSRRPARRTDPKTFDLISDFPNDILLIIGSNVHVRDLAKFARVSRRFYEIMQECLWRKAEHRLFWFPMFLGAAEGNIPLMEEALRRGCPVSKVWLCSKLGVHHGFKNGQTPLHLAVTNGHADAVDWLLARGASIDVNHARRLDKDLSLLLLAVNNAWKKTRDCGGMNEYQLQTLAQEWHVPNGPRYRIFGALVQAGARLPPDMDIKKKKTRKYLWAAGTCCRIVSTPTLQQLLQHGANIHYFCLRYLPPVQGADETYFDCWFWRTESVPGQCTHAGDFLPFSESDREAIWANMCNTLRTVDRKGRRLFCPANEVMPQPEE